MTDILFVQLQRRMLSPHCKSVTSPLLILQDVAITSTYSDILSLILPTLSIAQTEQLRFLLEVTHLN